MRVQLKYAYPGCNDCRSVACTSSSDGWMGGQSRQLRQLRQLRQSRQGTSKPSSGEGDLAPHHSEGPRVNEHRRTRRDEHRPPAAGRATQTPRADTHPPALSTHFGGLDYEYLYREKRSRSSTFGNRSSDSITKRVSSEGNTRRGDTARAMASTLNPKP